MTLVWYILSTYWYVPICTIIYFLYRSVLGTYLYVPSPNRYILNTLFLKCGSRFQMSVRPSPPGRAAGAGRAQSTASASLGPSYEYKYYNSLVIVNSQRYVDFLTLITGMARSECSFLLRELSGFEVTTHFLAVPASHRVTGSRRSYIKQP
jgi:hypothetical protein